MSRQQVTQIEPGGEGREALGVMDGQMGDVGKVIWKMAAGRGVQSKNKVWELAQHGGCPVSRPTAYAYFSGARNVPREFLRALDKVMRFTDAEKTELVRAVSDETRKHKELRDLISAFEGALNLVDADRIKVGWLYLWGQEAPDSLP